MNPTASQWSAWRTYSAPPWTAQDLATARAVSGTTISVVLPALNEEATIGPIVTAVIEDCMTHATLVDEVVVLDGHLPGVICEGLLAAAIAQVSQLPQQRQWEVATGRRRVQGLLQQLQMIRWDERQLP